MIEPSDTNLMIWIALAFLGWLTIAFIFSEWIWRNNISKSTTNNNSLTHLPIIHKGAITHEYD